MVSGHAEKEAMRSRDGIDGVCHHKEEQDGVAFGVGIAKGHREQGAAEKKEPE